jgi:hypothetical protein
MMVDNRDGPPVLRVDSEPTSHRQTRLRDIADGEARRRNSVIWFLIFLPTILITNILGHGHSLFYHIEIEAFVGAIMVGAVLTLKFGIRHLIRS